jgi:phosphomannomutase
VYPFGTSGYRSDLTEGFNDAVVYQLTRAVCDGLVQDAQAQAARGETPRTVLVVGGDTREKTRAFLPKVALWAQQSGFDVVVITHPVPTPLVAYAAAYLEEVCPVFKNDQSAGAILLTASHNPWQYGGFNVLTHEGAVAPSAISKRIEALQAQPENLVLQREALQLSHVAMMHEIDPTQAYLHHVKTRLGLDFSKVFQPLQAQEKGQKQLHVIYDGLRGAGQVSFPNILNHFGVPVLTLDTHTEGTMPNPTPERLAPVAKVLQEKATLMDAFVVGLANDGDADRFGVMDESGQVLDNNDVLLLVLEALRAMLPQVDTQGATLCVSQATSGTLFQRAEQLGYTAQATPVGFKYVAQAIQSSEKPVLLAGESSGGLTVLRHVPEKDGILANLLILALVAMAQKPLSVILSELKTSLRTTRFIEHVYHIQGGKGYVQQWAECLEPTLQAEKLASCFQKPLDVTRTQSHRQYLQETFDTPDGAKLFFQDGSWLLCRASGTEPVLRIYAEGVGTNAQEAEANALAMLHAAAHFLGLDVTTAKDH